MSSQKISIHRRRSQSTSARYLLSQSSLTHHSRKVANFKRSYGVSYTPSRDRVSRRKSDSSRRRRIKGQKRSLSVCSDAGPTPAQEFLHPRQPIFATTSDDFNLPLAKGIRRNSSWRSSIQATNPGYIDASSDSDNFDELCKMRSNAFWDLQRSVAESGEGLVRRMREHEHQRSKRVLAERGKLRAHSLSSSSSHSYLRLEHHPTLSDGSDDDDDIQIYAGESYRTSHSLNDVAMGDFNYSSVSSSPLLLASETASASNNPSPVCTPSSASHDSERTLAAITLAFASGAGSINDYSLPRSPHNNELGDAGDLWR